MRLKKGQKERLLEWIAEGLRSDEINERASQHEPFCVSRAQVDYYRRTRRVAIETIKKSGEHEALTTGLAKKAARVEKLKQLAALLEEDLFGDLLWLPQVKGVGSGSAAQIVDYVEFNRGEIEAYRGVLDDIAKEVGHRTSKMDMTHRLADDDLDSAIATELARLSGVSKEAILRATEGDADPTDAEP